jgi:membrane protease YdiL (CAAX protease family)
MTEEQPIIAAPPAEPERFPFWGYADVALIMGMALPCMFLGLGVVRLLMWVAHLHSAAGVQAVPEMLVGYGLLFTALMVIFRVQYDRPLWRSLGWTWTGVPVFGCIVYGCATLLLVGAVAKLIRTPPAAGPLMDMMKDRTALIVMAIFGSTAAPLFEELAFRGFLQPLLVRNLGAIGGILLTSIFFGGLHYSEYGESWHSALLIGIAGMAFGCMRQLTGSTAAAALMHASFNGLQFAALLLAPNGTLH